MKIKTKLSDIKVSPHSTVFFNSLEDNSGVYGKEQYKWNVLLKSFKKHGYDPTRFKKEWIKVTPSGFWEHNDTNTIKKFLLREGHHRVAICKYLYGDDYVIEVQLATHQYG